MTTTPTARTGPVPGDAPRRIPRRVHALGVFVLGTMYALPMFPDSAGLLSRGAIALLAPAVFYALARWDDTRTVDLLRERSAKARPSIGTVSP